ncbi:MAG: DNA polymerase III subunit epsilon [Porticoccaceae bacterium]|jgi:DNA polymerase-3 subunit epsilon|nr:DNA polymerase III subunit epsilon [Porticoccaceae bacterium]
MRQIVLDTETTGMEVSQDHRIIEIGAVELINRRLTGRHFHRYIHPQREIDEGAQEVHGISLEFLADKPVFHLIADEFLDFVRDAQLVIHNAPFDVGFINHEFNKLDKRFGRIQDYCDVVDTLAMARRLHPGQKNNLDALCKRYYVDNSQRQLHGALLDAEILADVYLAMTGGQVDLGLRKESAESGNGQGREIRRLSDDRPPTPVLVASAEELAAHQEFLERIQKQGGAEPLWAIEDSTV